MTCVTVAVTPGHCCPQFARKCLEYRGVPLKADFTPDTSRAFVVRTLFDFALGICPQKSLKTSHLEFASVSGTMDKIIFYYWVGIGISRTRIKRRSYLEFSTVLYTYLYINKIIKDILFMAMNVY